MIRWQPDFRVLFTRKWAAKGAIGMLMKGGVTLLLASGVMHVRPIMIYNASASVPVGFYRVKGPDPIVRDDLVLVRTPESVRELAHSRDYLPRTVPMIKHVAGLGGDTICAIGDGIFINGNRVVTRFKADRLYRPLPWWNGCRTLSIDEVFLLNPDAPYSFDSRYFGPVSSDLIVGKLRAL